MPDYTVCSIEGCERPVDSRGWCKRHYARWSRYGDPLAGGDYRGKTLAFIKQAVASNTDDCIEWPYARSGACDHGHLRIEGRIVGAHVMALILSGQPKPSDDVEACHNCGNGPCINPRHLRWDTHTENAEDARQHGTMIVGEMHVLAKLTDERVREARRLHAIGTRSADLAARYGVSQRTLLKAIRGDTWRHVA